VIQVADNSKVRGNLFINCGSTNNPVMTQGDGGSSKLAGYFEFIRNDVRETRTTGHPNYVYALQVADNYLARYRLTPGEMDTTSNHYFAQYVSIFERSDIKCSGQVNGATLAHFSSFNILSVTSHDANTVQINFRRKVDSALPMWLLIPTTAGKRVEAFGATADYFRVRFYDASTGALTTPGTFNINIW